MVQLKAYQDAVVKCMGEWFQFLYGTIKRCLRLRVTAALAAFQFLYGTIKSCQVLLPPMGSTGFQFLYSTIKRHGNVSFPARLSEFQFLYGTIKRNGQVASNNNSIGFNSSMVQLKGMGRLHLTIIRLVSIPLWYN